MGRSRGETQPHGREARGHQRPGRLLQAPRRGDGPALTTGVSAPRRKPGNVWAEEKPGPAWWGRRLEPKAWFPAATTPFAGRVASGPRQAPSPVPVQPGTARPSDATPPFISRSRWIQISSSCQSQRRRCQQPVT